MLTRRREKRRGDDDMAGAATLESIAAQLSALTTQTTKNFTDLSTSVSELKDDIKSLRSELSDVKESVDVAHKDIDQIKSELIPAETSALQTQVDELKTRLLAAETYSKKQNLLFWGIPHDANEDVEKKVRGFMSAELKVSLADSIPFVNVHRLPRMKGNPIIVKFVSQLHRDTVLRHAYRLQSNSGSGVSQHLPVALQRKKQELRPAFEDARKKNRKPRYRIEGAIVSLVVDGKSFKTPQSYFEQFA